MKPAPVRWAEPPEDALGVIRSCRERGWSFERISAMLNVATVAKRWPPPVGVSAWTPLLVRTTLEDA